jgi:hypothetical protein
MEVRRSRWYAAALVLPSGVSDVVGMMACEGVVAMAPNTEDTAVVFSTQAVISAV